MKSTAITSAKKILLTSKQYITNHFPIHSFGLLPLFLFLNTAYCIAQSDSVGFYKDLDYNLLIDSSSKLCIKSISITGNKRTKRYIIEREMRLKTGDTILASSIQEKLIRSQELIYNTSLFTEVSLVPVFISATEINIQVTVIEKWYVYPTPQFQLSDRNLNEWIKTYNADLERVIYGLKFVHYNLSGRRDQLRVYLLNGYARNISFVYTAPYSNKSLTEGFSVGVSYTQNREIIYKTSYNNLPLRFKNEQFVRKNFNASASYIKRKGFYIKQIFSLGFTYLNVDDSITSYHNPHYFNTNKNKAFIPEATYTFQYIHTNNINYPLKGNMYSLLLLKRGLGFNGGTNMLLADIGINRFLSHSHNWYSSFQSFIRVKAPSNLAYINQRALGYGDFYLRGLENYVIDGVATFLATYTIRKKIVAFKIPFPIKNKIVPFIPFTIYAKSYADIGYSHQQPAFNTQLGNRLLYTGGFGIDILSLYDLNLKLEYSFNQLGEKGLFLHAKGGF